MDFGGIGSGIASGMAGMGALLQPVLSYLGQQQQNSANWNIMNAQETWQEAMSNSAWQRGVEDMEKAGVNPALAYSMGPASTPAGSAIPQSDSALGAASKGLQSGVASAVDVVRAANTGRLNAAQADKADSDTALNSSLRDLYGAQTQATSSSARMNDAHVENLKANLPLVKKNAELLLKYGDADKIMNYVNGIFGTANKIFNSSGRTISVP